MNTIWKGASKKLDESDFKTLAMARGFEEAVVLAITLTEAGKSGYDRQGRLKALFEPHRFWRELGPGPKRDEAVRQGLAYPDWIPNSYPSDSYPRIIAASAIDETAALAATSWGFGQILGSNFKMAGYKSPQAMVASFAEDEENQFTGMFNFIKARGLEKAVREKNWPVFAEGYNGKKFRVHGYHIKLANNYQRALKIIAGRKAKPISTPVIKPKPVTEVVEPVAQTSLKVGARGPIVKAVQEKLNELGYFLRADRSFGPRTRDMIMAVEADMQWPITGEIGWDMLQKLDTVPPRAISPERAERTAAELAPESRIIQKSNTGEVVAVGSVAVGAVTEGSKLIPTTEGSLMENIIGFLSPLQTIRDFVGEHWGFVLLLGGLVAWQLFKKIKQYRVEDHHTGKTT